MEIILQALKKRPRFAQVPATRSSTISGSRCGFRPVQRGKRDVMVSKVHYQAGERNSGEIRLRLGTRINRPTARLDRQRGGHLPPACAASPTLSPLVDA